MQDLTKKDTWYIEVGYIPCVWSPMIWGSQQRCECPHQILATVELYKRYPGLDIRKARQSMYKKYLVWSVIWLGRPHDDKTSKGMSHWVLYQLSPSPFLFSLEKDPSCLVFTSFSCSSCLWARRYRYSMCITSVFLMREFSLNSSRIRGMKPGFSRPARMNSLYSDRICFCSLLWRAMVLWLNEAYAMSKVGLIIRGLVLVYVDVFL